MKTSIAILLMLNVAGCGKSERTNGTPPAASATDQAARPEVQPSAPDFRSVVVAARAAAAAGDLAKLRALMVDDFTFSFGDDATADGAIAAWKVDAGALRRMMDVLDGGCVPDAEGSVLCPAAAATEAGGLGPRIGFAEQPDGWKMVYFVVGD